MRQRIRVLIADGHEAARNGLKALLAFYPELEIVGVAADGQKAIQLIGEQRPDVILMGVRMPMMDGITATRLIKSRWPGIVVIALTMYTSRRAEAVEAGADACLLKGFEAEALHKTILATTGKLSVGPSMPRLGD